MRFRFSYLPALLMLLTVTACNTDTFPRAILGSSIDLIGETTPWSSFVKNGKYDLAISEINHLIDVQPRHPRLFVAYNDRGEAYRLKGDTVNAIADYETAININPKFAKAYNNLGLVYKQQGQLAKAGTAYSQALEADPKFTQAYCNRAAVYYSDKEYDKAWEDVQNSQGLCEKNSKFIDELRQASGRDR
jgi:tetratricopeptide (TPR) repeat protein